MKARPAMTAATSADAIDAAIASVIAMDTGHVVLGCDRTTATAHVPSLVRHCGRCHQAVWVSRRIAAVLPTDAEIVCTQCLGAT